MAKAANRNKSLLLEGVEVYYDGKTNSLNIISKDKDLNGEFFVKIKEGTPTDITLRRVFAEKTGNQAPLIIEKKALSVPTLTNQTMELSGRCEFPLGLSPNSSATGEEIISFEITPDGGPRAVLLTGMTGSGLVVVEQHILRKAYFEGYPVLKWSELARESVARETLYSSPHEFKDAIDRVMKSDTSKQMTIIVIDGVESYLKQTGQSFKTLAVMLRLARSRGVFFILKESQPAHLLEQLSNFVLMRIVGRTADTVASAIAVGDNSTIKHRAGTFTIRTDRQNFSMQSFAPTDRATSELKTRRELNS